MNAGVGEIEVVELDSLLKNFSDSDSDDEKQELKLSAGSQPILPINGEENTSDLEDVVIPQVSKEPTKTSEDLTVEELESILRSIEGDDEQKKSESSSPIETVNSITPLSRYHTFEIASMQPYNDFEFDEEDKRVIEVIIRDQQQLNGETDKPTLPNVQFMKV